MTHCCSDTRVVTSLVRGTYEQHDYTLLQQHHDTLLE
jgi:hypothetical protein